MVSRFCIIDGIQFSTWLKENRSGTLFVAMLDFDFQALRTKFRPSHAESKRTWVKDLCPISSRIFKYLGLALHPRIASTSFFVLSDSARIALPSLRKLAVLSTGNPTLSGSSPS
jgi:hypothetical protein